MSIIYLSSNNQRPQNFTNNFPAQINLGSNAEVSLIGYSGNLRGEPTTDGPVSITITEGINDTLLFYHGKVQAGTALDQIYYLPQTIKVKPGVYTPAGLATQLQITLNYTENLDQFRGAWTASYDTVANPGKITITCGKMRAKPNAGAPDGWIAYNTGIEQTSTALFDTLKPFVAGSTNCSSFICKDQAFTGDVVSQAIGSTVGSIGMEISFTTVGLGYDQCRFSCGYLPVSNACRAEADGLPTSTTGGKIKLDFSKPIDEEDFALTTNLVGESIGNFALGLVIREDGQIGKIVNRTGRKEDRVITWTATNLGGPGLKKLGMSPRYSANYPVMEFMCDIGAGWVSLGTQAVNIATTGFNLYRIGNLNCGVVVDPDYIDDGLSPAGQLAVDIKAETSHEATGAFSAASEPFYLGFQPYPSEGSDNTSITKNLIGIPKLQDTVNALGSTLGFLTNNVEVSQTVTATPGIISDDQLSQVLQEDELTPIIITCPDLGARGYIGMGGGGGTETQILGVANITGFNLNKNCFSGEVGENWIKLHNDHPINLTQLQIILKDSENREIQFLEPNFNVWLKFKCDAPVCGHKETLTIGNYSQSY